MIWPDLEGDNHRIWRVPDDVKLESAITATARLVDRVPQNPPE